MTSKLRISSGTSCVLGVCVGVRGFDAHINISRGIEFHSDFEAQAREATTQSICLLICCNTSVGVATLTSGPGRHLQ